MFVRSGPAAAAAPAAPSEAMLGFAAVPVSDADTVVVPPSYSARVIAAWGEPIRSTGPAYRPDNTEAEQALQVGQHHNGMHFFPIEGRSPYEGSSTDGLLVLDHEYIERRYLHAAKYAGQKIATDAVVSATASATTTTRC